MMLKMYLLLFLLVGCQSAGIRNGHVDADFKVTTESMTLMDLKEHSLGEDPLHLHATGFHSSHVVVKDYSEVEIVKRWRRHVLGTLSPSLSHENFQYTLEQTRSECLSDECYVWYKLKVFDIQPAARLRLTMSSSFGEVSTNTVTFRLSH